LRCRIGSDLGRVCIDAPAGLFDPSILRLTPRTIRTRDTSRSNFGVAIELDSSAITPGFGVDVVEPLERTEEDRDHHREHRCCGHVPNDAVDPDSLKPAAVDLSLHLSFLLSFHADRPSMLTSLET
jgi:hypothetical protein